MYKISVLVPIYGVEKYIKKCAESLFSNTYAEKCEFIFANDATLDSSIIILKEVINEYPRLKNNIKIIENEVNKGLAGTRNTLLNAASGEYILCVDSDDWVEPDYLESFYKEAERTNADIIGCGYNIFTSDNSIIKKNPILKDDYKENLKNLIDDSLTAYVWSKLIKRNLFVQNNISWVEGKNMYEDLYIIFNLLLYARNFSHINKYLYNYRIVNNSISNSNSSKKQMDEYFVFSYIKNKLQEMGLFAQYEKAYEKRIINEKLGFVSTNFPEKVSYYNLVFTEKQLKLNKIFRNKRFNSKILLILFKLKLYGLIKFLYILKNIKSKKLVSSDYSVLRTELYHDCNNY